MIYNKFFTTEFTEYEEKEAIDVPIKYEVKVKVKVNDFRALYLSLAAKGLLYGRFMSYCDKIRHPSKRIP